VIFNRLKKAITLFLFFTLSVLGFFSSRATLFAATSSSLTSQPTSLKTSDQSNQKFFFTINNDWDPGETIVFTFPSSYTTATIVEDDVDVAYGSTDLTTAATCAGSEQASVSMSSNVLTVTLCAGDAPTVVTGTIVTVEIGTNASASGLGTHKITNPSAVGTYFIDLSGTLASTGSIPMPIVSNDQSGVTALLAHGVSEPPSGGGDEPPSDPGPEEEPDEEPEEEPETPPVEEPELPPEEVPPEEEPETPPVEEPDDEPTEEPETPPEDPTEEEGGGEGAEVTAEVSVTVDGVRLPVRNGSLELLSDTTAVIRIDIEGAKEIKTVVVVIDGETYVLSRVDSDTFEGIVTLPSGSSSLSVVVTSEKGESVVESIRLNGRGYGFVYEDDGGRQVPIANAVLTVYRLDGGRVLWDANTYGGRNPALSSASGAFGWYAPNGEYEVVAERDGYEDASVRISVRNGILTPRILMKKVSAVQLPPIIETIGNLFTPVRDFFGNTTTTNVINAVNDVISSPEAETVANIALPVTTVVATSSAVVLASSFNLLPYLQYLFTAPFLFFSRRKRSNFGLVYHSMTKVPVELAIVRLYHMPDNRLVKSVVTNAEGKYFLFVPEPGDYRIQATKNGFHFPSTYLSGVKDDGAYTDVYTNQIVRVTEKDATIGASIPLDPSEASEHQGVRSLQWKRFLRTLQKVAAPLGFILSFYVVVISPTPFSIAICFIQFFALLISIHLAWPRKARGWGIVTSAHDRKPLGNVVVRLFEPRYNKLVESTLTDSRGRYSFLLGANEYFASFDRDAFLQKIVRPIDYRDKKEPAPLTVNVSLDPR
jgi:hypothetical protein